MIKTVVKNMLQRYFDHEVARTASSFAYYFLFSFFPMLIFLNSLVGYFGFSLEEFVTGLSVVPADVRRIAVDYIRNISNNQSVTLMVTGLGLSISSASIAVRELFRAVSRAAGEVYYKQTFLRIFWSVIFTIMLYLEIFLILVLFVGLEYFIGLAGSYFPIIYEYTSLIGNIRLIAAALFGAISLVILYMLAPSGLVNISYALPGAVVAETAWLIVSAFFSFYASNMARYSIIYGSIGALIILMLWFFLTAVILSMGGELNQVIFELKQSHRH